MLIAVTAGKHTDYPDHCPCHATKSNGLGTCGHEDYRGYRIELYCDYINTPSEHHNPPTRCPLIAEPMEDIRVEMTH